MIKHDDAPKTPLCTNVIRLQSYLLVPDEVILFDWLVVKQISFKYQPFHYSQSRIQAETRIKRSRLEAILDKFVSMKFLLVAVDANRSTGQSVRHFYVYFDRLLDKERLATIIDHTKPLFNEFLEYFKYQCSAAQEMNILRERQAEEALKKRRKNAWRKYQH